VARTIADLEGAARAAALHLAEAAAFRSPADESAEGGGVAVNGSAAL
jgi:predicted ATPase with chaperone activity